MGEKQRARRDDEGKMIISVNRAWRIGCFWTKCKCLSTASSAGSCEHAKEHSSPTKGEECPEWVNKLL
jgi:hypothetical protein